jgi:hypothetical protein
LDRMSICVSDRAREPWKVTFMYGALYFITYVLGSIPAGLISGNGWSGLSVALNGNHKDRMRQSLLVSQRWSAASREIIDDFCGPNNILY